MVVFPNAKINVGLYITSKRDDGFHNLETIFLPIPWRDALEMLPSDSDSTTLAVTGIPVDANQEDNIVFKAWQLLKHNYPELQPMQIHLHKAIPSGAGLGGGSADGAFALKMINDMASLYLKEAELIELSLQLGSDCPFFIINKPCIGYGRGEILEPVSLELKGWQILLINPGVHVPTGWAFSMLSPQPADFDLSTIGEFPVSEWKKLLRNDFQQPVSERFPAVAELIDKLYKEGADYAAMSGSGSTVYGLFSPGKTIPELVIQDHWKQFSARW